MSWLIFLLLLLLLLLLLFVLFFAFVLLLSCVIISIILIIDNISIAIIVLVRILAIIITLFCRFVNNNNQTHILTHKNIALNHIFIFIFRPHVLLQVAAHPDRPHYGLSIGWAVDLRGL